MLDLTLAQALTVLKHCLPCLQAEEVHSVLADDVVQSIKSIPGGLTKQIGMPLSTTADAVL